MKSLKHHRGLLLALPGLFLGSPAGADSNFSSNPNLPYPPSCVLEMDRVAQRGVRVFDGEIELYDLTSGQRVPFLLTLDRTPCAESNRSLIVLELLLTSDWADWPEWEIQVELPLVIAHTPADVRYTLQLAAEPNGWGAWGYLEREQTYLASKPRLLEDPEGTPESERRWRFVLDSGPDRSGYYTGWRGMSPTEYNGALRLTLNELTLELPATTAVLDRPAPLPLSGRHSGVWTIEGARDQGFQLSISEQVGRPEAGQSGIPELPLVLFLSQYTFDAQNRPLWLVGNVEFQPGATQVTVPMFRFSGGEFRGGKQARRELVGAVTLTSLSCNAVAFSYDFADIGLGRGERRLVRPFSLETAGYECRDFGARVAANRS